MAQWYWMKDGEKQGPVDTGGLKELAKAGKLKPADMIWRDGLPNWVAASHAKGLFGDANPPPADGNAAHSLRSQDGPHAPRTSSETVVTAHPEPAKATAGRRRLLLTIIGGGVVLVLLVAGAAYWLWGSGLSHKKTVTKPPGLSLSPEECRSIIVDKRWRTGACDLSITLQADGSCIHQQEIDLSVVSPDRKGEKGMFSADARWELSSAGDLTLIISQNGKPVWRYKILECTSRSLRVSRLAPDASKTPISLAPSDANAKQWVGAHVQTPPSSAQWNTRLDHFWRGVVEVYGGSRLFLSRPQNHKFMVITFTDNTRAYVDVSDDDPKGLQTQLSAAFCGKEVTWTGVVSSVRAADSSTWKVGVILPKAEVTMLSGPKVKLSFEDSTTLTVPSKIMSEAGTLKKGQTVSFSVKLTESKSSSYPVAAILFFDDTNTLEAITFKILLPDIEKLHVVKKGTEN